MVRDAKETRGFLTVWQKDERVWLEIAPEQFEQPFFFAVALASGLGERFFLPGLLGQEYVVVLRRVGNTVQLLARNLRVRAPAGTPLEAAVRESYSDSLLASAPVASAPHPDRKSVLVDATALLGGDIAGAQTTLETAYRVAYALDRANSAIERARATAEGTFITYRAHYAIPKLPAPPATPPAPNTPQPNPAQTVPDPRSLFLTYVYSLMPLPKEPMRPRVADQRLGHFTVPFLDLADPAADDRRTHYIKRWRLEKKDPQAPLSEPKEPIVVWMDRNIPERYREAVRAGILEWNKAFERAGFKDALVVRQQPPDADFSTLEGTRHLAVRWFAMEGPGAVAVGPSQSDPRTGEILRGNAIIPENWVRLGRTQLSETLPKPPASLAELLDASRCTYAFEALEQAAFAFDLLVARGALDPTGPEAERFIADSLKDVVMHEVGHALGLAHNFRASSGVKLAQLRDAAYVRAHGISHSVMDYNALNIPLENEPASVYNQVTLGAYDYWAIEYAYREFAPERERAELARLAARSATDPALAYGNDADAGFGTFALGIDPRVNRFDLGDDPLAYYERSFVLARELWRRTERRTLAPEDTLAFYRRNLARGLARIAAVVPNIVKYVGGTYVSREVAGSNEPALVPVPADKQRQALALLAREVFSADSFRFDPRFMQKLGLDHLERFRPGRSPDPSPDFSLASAVLNFQRVALDALMADALAARLADAETKATDARELLSFADVQRTLTAAIWSEVKRGRDIDTLRRNLQREHVRRVAAALLRATPTVAADVRAVLREVAVGLQADLKRALDNRRLNATTRAHLAESLALLQEALRAPLLKQGV
ncbi:MAG: zinc-dependent metalloprotease [Burkholderiaceae bacterium]|nr:zinc-dependent metalloprotease [Burkholderiaceae bacterium]